MDLVTDELIRAVKAADRMLERAQDPDSDAAIVARQLLRVVETAARHLNWMRAGIFTAQIAAEREAWRKSLCAALDMEGFDEGRYG